jgi:basic membrane lipoprotein Med (substrate-binding protein (PBP1-ABC) superfamily)
MKKIIALVLVAVMALLAFAGCGQNNADNDNAKKIVVAEEGSAGDTRHDRTYGTV